jgi:hypothetical protein
MRYAVVIEKGERPIRHMSRICRAGYPSRSRSSARAVDVVPFNFDDPVSTDDYIGTGTFEVDLPYANDFAMNCPVGVSCAGGGIIESWNGTLTVSYFYNPAAPIPEPSTWALMLAGFAGLGYAGWRRRPVPLAVRA